MPETGPATTTATGGTATTSTTESSQTAELAQAEQAQQSQAREPAILDNMAFYSAQATIKYVAENPIRTSLWALIPRTIVGGYYGRDESTKLKRDKYLARILIQISLMSPKFDVVKDINDTLLNLAKVEGKNNQERLEALNKNLCELFNALYSDALVQAKAAAKAAFEGKIRSSTFEQFKSTKKAEYEAMVRGFVDEAAFKKLKKRIHDYAEQHRLQRRLFNLIKESSVEQQKSIANCYRFETGASDDEFIKKKLQETGGIIFSKKDPEWFCHYIDEENEYQKKKIVNTQDCSYLACYVAQEIGRTVADIAELRRIAKSCGIDARITYRKTKDYIDLDHDDKNEYVRKYAHIPNQENKFTARKKRRRRIKKGLNFLSWLTTISVAIGEGMVASYLGQSLAVIVFAGTLITLPHIALAVLLLGIPAFAVNAFLFKGSTRKTFFQFFITGLFRDEKGELIPKWKRIVLTPTVTLTAFTGAFFGILSFTSTHTTILGFLAFVGVTAAFPPAGVALLAGYVAIMTGLALTALTYVSLVDLIKNDRIPQLIKYFKDRFFTLPNKSASGIVKHVLGCALELLFIGAGITGGIFITVAGFGFSYSESLKFLKATVHLSPKVAPAAAKVIAYIAYVAQGLFNVKNMSTGFRDVAGVIERMSNNLGRFIAHPQQTFREAKDAAKANPVRTIFAVGKSILKYILLGATVPNGYAWSDVGQNPTAQSYVSKVLCGGAKPTIVTTDIPSVSAGANSSVMNGREVAAETALPAKVTSRNRIGTNVMSFFDTKKEAYQQLVGNRSTNQDNLEASGEIELTDEITESNGGIKLAVSAT